MFALCEIISIAGCWNSHRDILQNDTHIIDAIKEESFVALGLRSYHSFKRIKSERIHEIIEHTDVKCLTRKFLKSHAVCRKI